MNLPTNCITGTHSCKTHNYAHQYAQHTCGHDFQDTFVNSINWDRPADELQ